MSENNNAIEQIAIIGMAGQFPGASNIDQFWQNLVNSQESISRFSKDQLKSNGENPERFNHPDYVNAGTIFDDCDLFDADFFGYSRREAEIMDPQQRIFLETAWTAMENAGYNPDSFDGSIGLFAGASSNEYRKRMPADRKGSTSGLDAFQIMVGNDIDFLTTRVSYKLNLKGPSLTIQTACSTTLVAIHYACQNLLTYQCDMALSGGISIRLPQGIGYIYNEGMIWSPDGHTRAFDADARGTIFGHGVGLVVLKRLSEAQDDGDNIFAIIKGSAVNNDGSMKVGFTAPSVDGQTEVIATAHSVAGVMANSISYVETHGTGTPLGDPIEIEALTQAFRLSTSEKRFCAIGSVKTNIGHLDIAAGIAGIIKTTLSLQHKKIPASLNYNKPNPNIDFENSPFFVNTKLTEWENNGYLRRAGVSSFGIGGTNAHIVMEEAPVLEKSSQSRPWQLVLLSAKTTTALDSITINLANHLKQNHDLNIADVTYTLQVGRRSFNQRRMTVCANIQDASEILSSVERNQVFTSTIEESNYEVAFMFSGQGSQYVNMALDLYNEEQIFREQLDYCCEFLKPHLGFNLKDILYPDKQSTQKTSEQLRETYITQPALFVIEYSLAKLWQSWGIEPVVMVGHSIGEYVAACLSGVFSLDDALVLVAARGSLMQSLPHGAMLAIPLPEGQVKPYLSQEISLAVINGASMCVVSGETPIIKKLEEQLAKEDIECRILHTSHAFHSAMMEPILDKFINQVSQIPRHAPKIPFVSNVSGNWITEEEATNPEYWAKHLRHTVRFYDCVSELLKNPNRIILEVGPGLTLAMLARQHPGKQKAHIFLSSLRRPVERKNDVQFILTSLGQCWLSGVKVNWQNFYLNEKRNRVPLPTYQFDRKRYWIEAKDSDKDEVANETNVNSSESVFSSDGLEQYEKSNLTYDDAPKTENEKLLAKIWHNLLGTDQIKRSDNFFDLGGSSLIAVSLFADIDKIFKIKFPLATLYEAPTIEELANLIGTDEIELQWKTMIQIKKGSSGPPLFLVHGAGGYVLFYRDLANNIDNDIPIYGIQSKGLDGKEKIISSIEEMAKEYIKEMKRVQETGPYYIGGYCMGGSVAYEMGQQLKKMDDEVGLIFLLETYNFSNIPKQTFLKHTYHNLQKVEFHFKNFLLLSTKSKWTFFLGKLKEVYRRRKVWYGTISTKLGFGKEDQSSTLAKIWKINDEASLSYVPKPYEGDVLQFVPVKEYADHLGPGLNWEDLIKGNLEYIQLPVYPGGMLIEPFVQMLADKIKSHIGTGEAK
jgi:phthiocerol/phenolphthiocerol synthesis type-I polyketide synthase E